MNLGLDYLHIVRLKVPDDFFYRSIKRDTIKKEIGLASFSINLINCYVVAQILKESREVRFIVLTIG